MSQIYEVSKKYSLSSDIKSKYILQIIFVNLQQKKLLKIINYNKKLQSLLNKDINDYIKDYFKIELEIIPKENICYKSYFINIPKGIKFKSRYHIYFNDNNEEVEKNYITKNDEVKTIKIVIDSEIKSLSKLFENCYCIKYINFTKFNRIDIKNMSYMFRGCSSLNKLNLSNFNTDNVTNMSYMFCGCSSLNELNLSNFNTDNVTNMSCMFRGCSKLRKLNISNFSTNNIKYIDYFLDGCFKISDLNCSNTSIINIYLNLFIKNF